MSYDIIIAATDEALHQVVEPRFLRTERGFQGQFYCALQRILSERGLLDGGCILEMEYQKSARHGLRQRPDIVLHVPAEESGSGVVENNLAVWALKRHATPEAASQDFEKLDEMFKQLCYPLGIFVNIDAKKHFAESYRGEFAQRLRTVAVWLDDDVHTSWGCPESGVPDAPANGPKRRSP